MRSRPDIGGHKVRPTVPVAPRASGPDGRPACGRFCARAADAHDLLVRAENADPGDGPPRAGWPGTHGPVDGEPARHRGGPAGDYGLGLPRGQAFAAPGVVVVMDADHVPRFKQPG